MTSLAGAVQQAAETLRQIAHSTAGERSRRAGTVALVLRALEELMSAGGGSGSTQFVVRRAEEEIEGIASAAERSMLARLLRWAGSGDLETLANLLVAYACELEGARRLPEADAVMELARSAAPDSAEVALHAGRIARMQGDRERALGLYRTVRELDRTGSTGRLAAVGEAVISRDCERSLSLVMRESLVAGDAEAAAVALEERARVRRHAGRRSAAARDLCLAAARFPDAVDRARVAHELADLCVSADDPAGAREALLVALAVGDSSQRDHARSRLHTVSRDLGDRVGMRRWRSFSRPALVSLSIRPGTGSQASLAGLLSRWRSRAEVAVR